jgi:translation initiation factor IF-1
MEWQAILGIVVAWTLGLIITLVKFGSSVSTKQAVLEERTENLEKNMSITREDMEAAIKKVLENGGVRTELNNTNSILTRLEGKVQGYMDTQNQINIRLEDKITAGADICKTNSADIAELTRGMAHISGILEKRAIDK